MCSLIWKLLKLRAAAVYKTIFFASRVVWIKLVQRLEKSRYETRSCGMRLSETKKRIVSVKCDDRILNDQFSYIKVLLIRLVLHVNDFHGKRVLKMSSLKSCLRSSYSLYQNMFGCQNWIWNLSQEGNLGYWYWSFSKILSYLIVVFWLRLRPIIEFVSMYECNLAE